jgi:hypothetical protein
VSDFILFGDSERSAALRHEVPVAIGDPFLFAEADGRAYLLSNALDRANMARARPDAILLDLFELGFGELAASGMPAEAIRLELVSRAVGQTGIRQAIIDFDFPVAVADRLRADGVDLTVDEEQVRLRRRVRSELELAGIRRAQRSAEAGMSAAAALLRQAEPGADGVLHVDGRILMAEAVRAEVRQACAAAGAPASSDLIRPDTPRIKAARLHAPRPANTPQLGRHGDASTHEGETPTASVESPAPGREQAWQFGRWPNDRMVALPRKRSVAVALVRLRRRSQRKRLPCDPVKGLRLADPAGGRLHAIWAPDRAGGRRIPGTAGFAQRSGIGPGHGTH